MTNKRAKKEPEEISYVTATVIKLENTTTIITPNGKLFLYDGRVTRVEPVNNYASAVNKEINAIKRRASSRLFTGDYLIQMYGKLPDLKTY